MVETTCDLCGRVLGRMERQYVAHIDVRPTVGMVETDEDPGDRDHLMELHEMLEAAEDEHDFDEADQQSHEFLLCHECCCRFCKRPLPRETALQLDFSEN